MMDLRRLDWILAKAQTMDTLDDWELSFIEDMMNQREALGDDITISPKQEVILERISGKE